MNRTERIKRMREHAFTDAGAAMDAARVCANLSGFAWTLWLDLGDENQDAKRTKWHVRPVIGKYQRGQDTAVHWHNTGGEYAPGDERSGMHQMRVDWYPEMAEERGLMGVTVADGLATIRDIAESSNISGCGKHQIIAALDEIRPQNEHLRPKALVGNEQHTQTTAEAALEACTLLVQGFPTEGEATLGLIRAHEAAKKALDMAGVEDQVG